jgi:hypothetical protein
LVWILVHFEIISFFGGIDWHSGQQWDWREDLRRRRRIPNPAITIIAALAGSGTLANVGKDNPLASAKASKAATSPAETAPLTPWLKFAAKSAKSAVLW